MVPFEIFFKRRGTIKNKGKNGTIVQLTVTVASSPSGTLATMIPMRKITASRNPYLRMKARKKNVTPRNTATPEMMWMKCSISIEMGVSENIHDVNE